MPFNLADFYNETRAARKIIVIDLGYLGDSIHLVPSLWEIKANYPEAEVHVAAAPVGTELLAMAPCVDRTWPLVRTVSGTPWREQWTWLKHVRREHFDLVFNFSGTDRTIFLSYLTGARWRVAFAAGRQHFWNCWLIPHWVPRLDRSVRVAEQRRQVLQACGLRLGSLHYDLQVPPAAIEWAKLNVPPGAVHLSLNAGHALKEWPLESWIALTQRLLAHNPDLTLVATGSKSPREQERLQRFGKAVQSQHLLLHPGNLTLAQLAALLARCRLHVGADSGALHLASVLGVKTVSLFRDYAGLGEWMPRGADHRSIVVPCRCVNQRNQPCAAAERPECLAQIPVEQVYGLVVDSLKATGV
jgi:heptosyltransferase-1/heptosyltransferase-2